MRIIGLDVGEKRIGVAKADSSTRIAIPVGFVNVDGTEWQEITKTARLNNTNLFVLGLPRSNDGNETAQSQYVRRFAKTLTEQIPGARIKFQDESLTSVLAEERLKSRKKPYEKGDIDAEAASIILQDFLEGLKNISSNSASSNQPGENQQDTDAVSGHQLQMPELIKKQSDRAIQELQNAKELAKKQSDKVLLNTKKAKHKMRTSTKWITGLIILVILGVAATGAVLWIKDLRAKERAEEYARQEAEMEAATFDFTVRPGETVYDIKKHLLDVNRNGENSEGELENYTEAEIDEALTANYDFAFLKERPSGSTLEGFLYPETHNFFGDSTVKDVLTVFLKEMEKTINENDLEAKYRERGLSLFEGISLASVVQKEASPKEQPTVAQVFLSRLSYGIPLGSDVTVSYALDTIDPDRKTYSDNQSALAVDSCYNTRLHGGLPCGPISNPGLTALLAVANPSDSSYLYFLTGDDGMMYYSYTEAEHNQNIYSHCKELCNVSL